MTVYLSRAPLSISLMEMLRELLLLRIRLHMQLNGYQNGQKEGVVHTDTKICFIADTKGSNKTKCQCHPESSVHREAAKR